MRTFIILVAALALGGCATTYQLSVMPRDSGKIYSGTAESSGGAEGRVSITIENKTFNGTWVQLSSDYGTAYVSGGWGWHRGWGAGVATYDNPNGAESKALLTSADGSGLRCNFRGGYGYGGGVCRDDSGREYDVQLRPAPRG
jgi:hypothetical protein